MSRGFAILVSVVLFWRAAVAVTSATTVTLPPI